MNIALPSTQLAVGAKVQTLTGSMADDQMELSQDSLPIENGLIEATLPRFSISVISLKKDAITSVQHQVTFKERLPGIQLIRNGE